MVLDHYEYSCGLWIRHYANGQTEHTPADPDHLAVYIGAWFDIVIIDSSLCVLSMSCCSILSDDAVSQLALAKLKGSLDALFDLPAN